VVFFQTYASLFFWSVLLIVSNSTHPYLLFDKDIPAIVHNEKHVSSVHCLLPLTTYSSHFRQLPSQRFHHLPFDFISFKPLSHHQLKFCEKGLLNFIVMLEAEHRLRRNCAVIDEFVS